MQVLFNDDGSIKKVKLSQSEIRNAKKTLGFITALDKMGIAPALARGGLEQIVAMIDDDQQVLIPPPENQGPNESAEGTETPPEVESSESTAE